ncbi:glycosyltransferase family 32 protein [Pseudoduganella lutea]|uniref:Polysaccharide biosynthesis protein n=1 Tax=Pseudoduganella lutea TaxID=321985 RepID=A0A4P6KUV1_9BURK|nr:glycosyltransferase [Pseudoduganella lutea]QBE62524.1 polysaccharide biosynthesis protein [Pseudoduganella lutea]
MIPKTIHYCWFGNGEMSVLHKRCIATWKRYCPDYEFVLWNESNSNIDNDYCREAIKQRKWAFVADWVRFDVLARHGGIYLDTDVELLRSLDEIAAMSGCVLARESKESVATGFIACEAGDPVMQNACRLMLEDLTSRCVFATSPIIVMQALALSSDKPSTVLESETFYPFNPWDNHRADNAKQLMFSDITPRTIGIHHYNPIVSWGDFGLRSLWLKVRRKARLPRRWDISFKPFDRA